jgi:hypothetical protein
MEQLASGKAATYTRTGTDVAFIISELPGERAEALLYCKGSVGAHGGRAIQTPTEAQAARRAVLSA